MTRDEKIAEARRMRAEGEILRVIGDRFGVSPQTILRWTDDEFAERSRAVCRANKLKYRGVCVDCGTHTIGDAPGHAPERCVPCNGAHTRKLTRAWILDSFAEWHAIFGKPPVVAEWQPAMARYLGRQDCLDRHAATGRPWPSETSVQAHFGSWNEGVAAAGLTPTPRGFYRDESSRKAILRAAHGTEARRARLADLYAQGLTYREMAERMGVSPQCICSHLYKMRADGWDLPYRRTDLVAA